MFGLERLKVVVVDINIDLCQSLVQEIVSQGGDALAVKCDVSDAEAGKIQ